MGCRSEKQAVIRAGTVCLFLPAIVLMLIFGELFYVALPILIVAGIVGMAARA